MALTNMNEGIEITEGAWDDKHKKRVLELVEQMEPGMNIMVCAIDPKKMHMKHIFVGDYEAALMAACSALLAAANSPDHDCRVHVVADLVTELAELATEERLATQAPPKKDQH